MTNDEWLWYETAVYRGRMRGMRRTDILAEIATSLHEIAQQLAERNGYVDPKTVNPIRAVQTVPLERIDKNGW